MRGMASTLVCSHMVRRDQAKATPSWAMARTKVSFRGLVKKSSTKSLRKLLSLVTPLNSPYRFLWLRSTMRRFRISSLSQRRGLRKVWVSVNIHKRVCMSTEQYSLLFKVIKRFKAKLTLEPRTEQSVQQTWTPLHQELILWLSSSSSRDSLTKMEHLRDHLIPVSTWLIWPVQREPREQEQQEIVSKKVRISTRVSLCSVRLSVH